MHEDTRYRLVWVRDDKGTRGVLCPGPFTLEQAQTVLRKLTDYSWRRILVEAILY